jgi:Co/Zn/Cd efflux system component
MTWMSIIGLIVNLACLALLYKYRQGDSNMRSVWLCSRNDVLGNIAVMFAAGGVFATATVWPDIIVAAILAWLALSASWEILRHARQELSNEER